MRCPPRPGTYAAPSSAPPFGPSACTPATPTCRLGTPYDDRQPGAPYRTKQIRRLLDIAAKEGHRAVFGGDLNAAPPDSRTGAAAGRRAVAPAYRRHRECDQRGGDRTGRWTHLGSGGRKKLDYVFAPPGAVRRCHVGHGVTLSDHRPLYAELAL
ncbi:endonuclease/exonuclease/phosphatase family protein [Nonomuraea ferruginea]